MRRKLRLTTRGMIVFNGKPPPTVGGARQYFFHRRQGRVRVSQPFLREARREDVYCAARAARSKAKQDEGKLRFFAFGGGRIFAVAPRAMR
jgi:hypothetical protein